MGFYSLILNNPFFYITLVALLIKIWAGYRLRQNRNMEGAGLCLLFLILAYTQTIIEIYGYVRINTELMPRDLFFFKLYYLCIGGFISMLPLFFLRINKKLTLKSYICSFLGFIFIFAGIMHPTLVISGMTKLQYNYTRVPGPYYWVFTVYCLFMLIVTFIVLIHSYKTSKKEFTRIKVSNLLITFIPFVIAAFGLALLMRLNLAVNAIGFIPLLLSILVLGMVENLRVDYVYDLRIIIPGAKKFMYAINAIKPFFIAKSDPESDKDYIKLYEKALMDMADDQYEKQTDKIKFLKKSKATYYRLLKEREK